MYVLVAVSSPFNESILIYKARDEDLSDIRTGAFVKVPLGKNRIIDGCIIRELQHADININEESIKYLTGINREITIGKKELELFTWMAKYYHYPLGVLIFDLIPVYRSLKERKKCKIIQANENAKYDFKLTQEQKEIAQKIIEKNFHKFSKYLLHGVTGSGKSIVYLEIISEVLATGKSVQFLLPEINLTPQFIKMFSENFTAPIIVYSSALKEIEKREVWKFLRSNRDPVIVVGARSSLFLPIKNLGIIVVDEEHDQSYKQEVYCPYNARDVAIKKASIYGIPIMLGSATPSLETYFNFVNTENYFPMKQRAQGARLPRIELVDIRKKSAKNQNDMYPFTEESIRKIAFKLEKNEQVIIFINKLGFSLYIQCPQCGHRFECKNCSVSLKHFKKRNMLICQTCEYKEKVPEMCPECMCINLKGKGFGTEKIQEQLQGLFKNKKVERFDRDEIQNANQLEEKLAEFHKGNIDILVGTQMLSKGHNFKRVNLVVILGIDTQLNFPDFRSNEKVYQSLIQVSGRAGRFGQDSEVLIHTLSPDNNIFKYVREHLFNEFYIDELNIRTLCKLPPMSKLVSVHLSHKDQDIVINESNSLRTLLNNLTMKYFKNVDILGPRPSIVEKKVNKFTWSLLLKSSDVNELHNLLKTLETVICVSKKTSVKIDIDPQTLDI